MNRMRMDTPDTHTTADPALFSEGVLSFVDPPRDKLVETVIGHPKQSVSIVEFDYMNPSLSESTIRYHASELCDSDVFVKRTLDSEQRIQHRPYTFYELSDDTENRLQETGVVEWRGLFRDLYHVVWKPDRILEIESMPRPE